MKAAFKKLFGRKQKKATPAAVAKDTVEDDPTESSHTHSSKNNRPTYKIVKTTPSVPKLIVEAPKDGPTQHERLAERWIFLLNNQRPQEEMIDMFVNPEAGFVFEDGFHVPAKYLVPNMHYVYTCFPDFKLSNQGYKEVKPGVVLIEEQILTGTHTGEPFKFDKFPPVPTTNKAIALDPERAYLHFNDDGKITKIEMLAMGDLVGLHGMYLAIGGKLEMPAEPKEEPKKDETAPTPAEEGQAEEEETEQNDTKQAPAETEV